MKVVTYNLKFGGSGRVHWKEIIDRYDPDVLLVQESFQPSDHLPDDQRTNRSVWSPVVTDKGPLNWGSGIYFKGHSPTPIQLPTYQGWVVGAEVDSFGDFGTGKIRFFSLHAASVKKSYAKVVNEVLDILLEYREGCVIVIGGDFNLTVGERHESEEMETSTADRKIQQRLYYEFGMINCWQTKNPNQPLPQTLRWMRDPEPPFHCDGLFVPASWRDRLISCQVIVGERWDKLSDHNPMIAEFA